MTKVLCVYHANCADGLTSAWVIHHGGLSGGVEFVAAKYGDTPPAATGRDVLIVDFSFPLEMLEALAREARSVLVLDHHKTAQEDLKEILIPASSTWMQPIINPGPNLRAVFDMNRSGAAITWDYFIGGSRSPLIDLVEDRDLWRFKLADSRAFHAVLSSYDWSDLPAMFERIDAWEPWIKATLPPKSPVGPDPEDADKGWSLLGEGDAILRAQDRAVAAAVAGSRRTMRIAGHIVPVVNVPNSMASDAGHLLCQDTQKGWEKVPKIGWDGNFSATYYDAADGHRHFSLRSPPGGADVSRIAKEYGGGGHRGAASFVMLIGWEGER